MTTDIIYLVIYYNYNINIYNTYLTFKFDLTMETSCSTSDPSGQDNRVSPQWIRRLNVFEEYEKTENPH